MHKIVAALAALFIASSALAQSPQLGAGQVLGNSTAAQRPGTASSVTSILDRALGSTRGSIIERGVSGWGILPPGTSGLPLVSGGVGADPAYNVLGLSAGGCNAALTASNGGILYSTASACAILAGTATARQMLQSGASASPAWSTSTWPATTAANQLLYSSSANTVAGLATANGSILNTDVSGVPALTPNPVLGVAGSVVGSLGFRNATSGTATLQPVTGALGTPIILIPAASGTVAVSATSPLTLNAAGAIACATCVTSSGGGAISGTSPVAVSSAGVVSIVTNPAFTGTASFANTTNSGTLVVNGLVGVGTASPVERITIVSNIAAVSPLSVSNTDATSYAQMVYKGSARVWSAGVGNASEVTLGVPNKFFIFDATAGAARLAIDTTGNVSIPNVLTIGTAGSIVGSIGLKNATSGTATLQPVTGALGTPTILVPNASGTIAVSASAPLVLNAASGALTCPTCTASAGTPLGDMQNITTYGAVAGSTSGAVCTANSAAMASAWAVSAIIYVPAGNFCIDPTVAPSNARGIVGDGNLVSILSGTLSGSQTLLTFSASSSVLMQDIGIEIPVSTILTTTGLSIANTTDSKLTKVRSRGWRAITLFANVNLTLDNWLVDSWYSNAVYVNNNGTGSGDKVINGAARGNVDPATGGNTVFFEGSFNATADNNEVTAASGFGITASSSAVVSNSGIKITNNRITGNKLECITLGGIVTSFEISGNVCSWAAGTDFGISVQALGVSGQRVQNGQITNNVLNGPGAGAVAIIGDVLNVSISDNTLVNFASPTRAGYVTPDSSTGISLTGITTYSPIQIRVANNYFRSASGFESYTVGEFNAGSDPNNNFFSNNDGTVGASGFYKILGSGTRMGPSIVSTLGIGGPAISGRTLVVTAVSPVQPTFGYNMAGVGAGNAMMGLLYDGASALAFPGLVYQTLSDTGAFVSNNMVVWRDGSITLGSTNKAATGSVKTQGYVVGSLPTCNAAAQGSRLYVTDANAPTFNAVIAAGGAVIVPVFCNGANWLAG